MQNQYYAQITWQGTTPVAATFNDIYYSLASGIEETRHVFLDHNNLPNRFAALKDNDIFVIAETGFGSGLNFLATIQLWQQVVRVNAQLFFISFEKYPLHPTDLKKVLANFPELTPQIQELIAQYYLPLPATHRLSFTHNVFLNLIIGDINDTIVKQNFIADAWFLDGFTPTKNEEIWNDLVIKNISKLSSSDTTFATFTANSNVRRSLVNHGFTVNKASGFKKRDMLFGHKNINTEKIFINKSRLSNNKPIPWFDKYHNINQDKKVIVIGGGISGATTAYSLARRGYKVTLYERNSKLAMEASGNYQAILYGSFSVGNTPIQELSFSGYRYSHNLIQQFLNEQKQEYQQCGLVQLLLNAKDLKKQQKLLELNLPNDFWQSVNQEQIIQIAGIEVLTHGGTFFPYGLWFNPSSLINKLCTHPNIKITTNLNIDDLIQLDDNTWDIINNGQVINNAENVVLCNAHAINQFAVTKHLTIRKIRGQISIVNSSSGTNTILCANSYIMPNRNDNYTIGATFNFKDLHTEITFNDHQENIANTNQFIPNFNQTVDISNLTGQANIRVSSYDYVPIVGPIANYEIFNKTYTKLSQDANYWLENECPYYKGLFINTAHGAKGMLTAPICGEIIADYIDNTPMPCPESLRIALHPNRIYVRNLVKNHG